MEKRETNRLMLVMLALFMVTDGLLYFAFGYFLLGNMEYSGLKVLSSAGVVQSFDPKDYFFNCTCLCFVKDIILTVLYRMRMRRNTEKIEQRTDIVYFWLLQITISLFLNIHSTAMIMGVLEYSRESRWREYGSPKFKEAEEAFSSFVVPEGCFQSQKMSLLLAISVLLITFGILLNYPQLLKKKFELIFLIFADLAMFPFWNERIEWKGKILILVILAVLFVLSKMLEENRISVPKGISGFFQKIVAFFRKPTSPENLSEKKDLHRYVRIFSRALIIVTVAWFVLAKLTGKDNLNSLYGIQYSAIIKLITPILLLCGIVLESTERSNPEKYIQHSPNLYRYNVLTLILIACGALMVFSEFGSVVCIMILTMLMYLLFVDFADAGVGFLIGRILFSVIVGGLIGVEVVLVENAGLNLLLRKCGLDLGGEFGKIRFNSPECMILGFVSLALLVILAVQWMFSLLLKERPTVLRYISVHILNFIEKVTGKLTIQITSFSGKIISALTGHKWERKSVSKKFPQGILSISIMIPMVGMILLYYNFFLNAYSGTTVLKNFYMQAGNFSNEFEITENITDIRANQVEKAIALEKAKENADPAEETETIPEEIPIEDMEYIRNKYSEEYPEKEIEKNYQPQDSVYILADLNSFCPNISTVYKKKSVFLKVMHIIDRLCFSSYTSELSAVQQGLKQNMGFDAEDIKMKRGYISTLQEKNYLIKSDLMNAGFGVRSAYLKDDGTLKDEFRYLNGDGEPPEEGQTEYVWVYASSTKSYTTEFKDGTVKTTVVPTHEWQKIFRDASPTTATSDYVLYTLSKMGIGNMLLLIFTPYFFMIVLLLATNINVSLTENTMTGYVRYILHNLGTLYAVSFMIQAVVIVWGVFGVSLFSGLSLPLIASGNFEMLLNSICSAVILISVGDLNKAESTGKTQK